MLPPAVRKKMDSPPPFMAPRKWERSASSVLLSGSADSVRPPLVCASIEARAFSGSSRVMLPPAVVKKTPRLICTSACMLPPDVSAFTFPSILLRSMPPPEVCTSRSPFESSISMPPPDVLDFVGPLDPLGSDAATGCVHVDRSGDVANGDAAAGGLSLYRGSQIAHIEAATRCFELDRIVARHVDRESHVYR
jgi:hypothetical protein